MKVDIVEYGIISRHFAADKIHYTVLDGVGGVLIFIEIRILFMGSER